MDKIKVGVVILALLQPLIIIGFFGLEFKSFSKCWGTMLEPLFILTNAATSFFFFSLNRWRIPAVFLMLLTAFSTDTFSSLHNFLAISFFISCVYGLAEFKRTRLYLILYCFSGIFCGLGLFWIETYATYVLCFYHLHLLFIKYKFDNRNDD